MKFCRIFFFLLILVSTIFGQDQLLDPKLKGILQEGLSGELAKDHVIEITRHSRIQGSRQYRDAGKYVLGQLRRFGFSEKDAYTESFEIRRPHCLSNMAIAIRI